MWRLTAFALVLALAPPCTVQAQQQPDADPGIDSTKLGVSLDRIQRELDDHASTPADGGAPLRLNVRVDVLGQAPAIEIFRGFNLKSGPVPRGGPTHTDMLDMLTPQEFSSPVVPFEAIALWAGREVYRKVQERHCADEMTRYRERIEAGLTATVPACAQP